MDKKPKVWVSRIEELLRLKSELVGRRVTPEDLGDFVGVSRQTIYTWMSDDGVPTIAADKTAKVAEFFNVPVWRVWTLAEEKAEQETEPGQPVAESAA